MDGLYLPDSPCVIPIPAWSLMLMPSVTVISSVGIFFSVSLAVEPVGQKQYNNNFAPGPVIIIIFLFCTVNSGEIPVGRLLAAAQDKGEGLSEGGVVSVCGCDKHRLGFRCADEDLVLHQFGEVVVDIQQPHVDDTLGRHFGVVLSGKRGEF